MSAAQNSGTGAFTEMEDEKVRKDTILSNRDKAQRAPGRGLDGKSVQVDEYKDNPANHRPPLDESTNSDVGDVTREAVQRSDDVATPDPTEDSGQVDRPGFDLAGASGKTDAGKGLGLGGDAKKSRKQWGLPRKTNGA